MVFTANQVADWFLFMTNKDKGDTMSHLKLQKLIYYSQAWHYTLFNEVIFNERIEAWMHGPVIRSVYDRFIDTPVYSTIDIEKIAFEDSPFKGKTLELLEDILIIYGEHNSSFLEELTHSEDPWKIARGNLPLYARCEKEITLDSIKEYYSKKLNGE